MDSLRRITVLLLAAALVYAGVAVLRPPKARAGINAGVVVNNSASQPVPVTGNVGINGMPTVHLAPGTTVGVTGGTFNFSNTASTPIFTRDKDNPALAPFQTILCIGLSLPTCGGLPNIFTVDMGHQFVIEYVSVRCQQLTNPVALASLETTAGGNTIDYYFPSGQVDSSGKEFIATQQVRIYADPGTNVQLLSFSTFGSGDFCVASLSGHLVTP